MMKLGNKVCVLGGAGFVGRAVIPALSAAGYEVTVVVRRPERYREFSLLPNVYVKSLPYLKADTLIPLVQQHDILISLLTDQSNPTETVEDDELVGTIQAIKNAAEKCGLARLVHLSQIGANASQAKSNWLRVLGEVDSIIHNLVGTQTTVLRAGLLIGAGDDTTQLYKNQLLRFPVAMVPHAETQIQPLSVKDFARALVQVIKQPSTFNAKLDVAGEERMTVQGLAEWVKDFLGMDNATLVPMCQLNAKFMLMLGMLAPFKTVTPYQQKRLAQDLVTQQDFATQFGFEPTGIERVLAGYIHAGEMKRRFDFFRTQAGRDLQEFK